MALLRRAVLAIAVCSSHAAAQSDFRPLDQAAKSEALVRVITLRVDRKPLQEVVQEITRQAGLGLSYRPELRGLSQPITIELNRVASAEALQRVLRGSGLEAWASANGQNLLLREGKQANTAGSIRGVVRDEESNAPVAGAEVRVLTTGQRVLTGRDGAFVITNVAPGSHQVEAITIGYASARLTVEVTADQVVTIELRIRPVAIQLSDVVVTPGHFGIAHESANKPQTLTREQIETLPQLAEDIYRTVNRLPGIGSHEFSAKFSVRGSRDHDLLVLLDDLEMIEPYHLKDFDGALSIIDVAAVGGVDLTTGGFSAEHGNRLTGVFNLRTTSRVTPRPRTSVGLSISNLRVMSQGSFANGNGLWLFSARRGYLDILLKLAGQGDNLDPSYYDVLGKVVYQLAPKHRLSLRALRAGDEALFIDDDNSGTLNSTYGSSYVWATWNAEWSDRLSITTIASAGKLDWNRHALEADAGGHFQIDDEHDLVTGNVKQDWQVTLSDRLLLRWGGELRSGSAEYDYFKMQRHQSVVNHQLVTRFDTTQVNTDPTGNNVGVYLSQRSRPWSRLTLETGVRYDRQSHTDEGQLSPRVNTLLDLGAGTTLRAAWGRYAQPQALHQLHYRDGESSFHPAEHAEQVVLGVERVFGPGIRARIEAYRRRESDLQPRYYNLNNSVEPVAEVEGDRIRIAPSAGRAEGVELFVQSNAGRSSWSASYALARAEDRLDGKWTPRPLEARHTLYFDYSFSPNPNWRLSWSWQYHTGWPATALVFRADTLDNRNVRIVSEWQQYNSDRFPAYHRMDLRATRSIDVKGGRLSLFLDVFNAYNRKNTQSWEYNVNYSPLLLRVNRTIEPLLPRMPTIGATWEF